jgi:HAD superfamily hydrolase (TIGR01509 family)
LEELTRRAFDWHDLDARRQRDIIADLAFEPPMHGATDVLHRLELMNVPRAVVSSSSHAWVDGWLDRLQLTSRFHFTICRGDAPRIKPAPDLYLAAANRLGVDARRCLVIEDSLNGLVAAKAAGMRVWIVPNRVTSCLDFSAADRVLHSLAEWAGEIA